MKKYKILVVDDEESLRFTFSSFLEDAGYEVETAENYEQAVQCLGVVDFDLIVADILLGDKTGMDLLREVKERKINCSVVMVTGYPNVETASEAVRLGAFDYLSKPVREENLLNVARIALRQKELADEAEMYRSHLQAVFSSVKDGIITMDSEMVITDVNMAAAVLCGIDAKKAVGQEFGDISDGCLARCKVLVVDTLESQEGQELRRHECQTSNGANKIITINTALLREGAKNAGVVLVLRDETRLAGLESSLNERGKYLRIIGKSSKMQELYGLIDNLKNLQTTVLIYGETGTGKELVAEALHYSSDDKDKPLVKVNCAALPENLLESELFGHVKGAFTGAIKDKVGRFEKANGGSIMLDEISEISPRLQLRLLRVLQEKEFERVGDSKTIKVDVRIIAATNQDLQEKVRQNIFREDLYYRLNVVEIHIPPLRDKRQDIPLLSSHFIEKFNQTFPKTIEDISDEVKSIFFSYHWPGNIRELEHTIEHAFVVCQGSVIAVEHLPAGLKEFYAQSGKQTVLEGPSETDRIIAALRKTGWNKAKAARLLGVSRQTIYRKIVELELIQD